MLAACDQLCGPGRWLIGGEAPGPRGPRRLIRAPETALKCTLLLAKVSNRRGALPVCFEIKVTPRAAGLLVLWLAHSRSGSLAILPAILRASWCAVGHSSGNTIIVVIGASQAEADEEILTCDIPDAVLERAGNAEQQAFTMFYCTHHSYECGLH
jgi:hypothetical protein